MGDIASISGLQSLVARFRRASFFSCTGYQKNGEMAEAATQTSAIFTTF